MSLWIRLVALVLYTTAYSSRGADLKTIYQAADEQKALAALDRVIEKWTPKYPNSMKRWKDAYTALQNQLDRRN